MRTPFMDWENIQQLFDQTLAGDYDDEDAWAAVRTLRSDGSSAVF